MEMIIYILILIILENDFYKDVKEIYPYNYDFIVNKNYKVNKNYIPNDQRSQDDHRYIDYEFFAIYIL